MLACKSLYMNMCMYNKGRGWGGIHLHNLVEILSLPRSSSGYPYTRLVLSCAALGTQTPTLSAPPCLRTCTDPQFSLWLANGRRCQSNVCVCSCGWQPLFALCRSSLIWEIIWCVLCSKAKLTKFVWWAQGSSLVPLPVNVQALEMKWWTALSAGPSVTQILLHDPQDSL